MQTQAPITAAVTLVTDDGEAAPQRVSIFPKTPMPEKRFTVSLEDTVNFITAIESTCKNHGAGDGADLREPLANSLIWGKRKLKD